MTSPAAYIGRKPAGQSRWRIAACAAALVLSGCSVSMSGFLATEDEMSTGSISVDVPGGVTLSKDLNGEDWRRASAALAVALDPQGNGAAAAWANPESGLKGQFSAVGAPFVKNDEVCRDFLATMVTTRGQDWLQGSACRPSGGEWALRAVKPWKKPA